MLDVAESYHFMQIQGKRVIKTQENGITRYHDQLSSCTISEKTNDLILRKFSDGRTDGWTDRRTRVIS